MLQLCFRCCDLHFCIWDVFHVVTPICYVATTLFCMQHHFLSRPSFSGCDITFLPLAYLLCRDLKISVTTSKHLLSLKYVVILTLLVATRSVHPLSILCRNLLFLSRPKLLFQHLFCLNKLFHIAEVSVATEEDSVATDTFSSVQYYVATQTILSPVD